MGRLAQLEADDAGQGPTVDLRALHGASELAPLLTMFDGAAERQAVAVPLYRRAVGDTPELDHVGGLADVTLPAAAVRADKRLVQLRARLERRAGATRVPMLTPADIAALKPHVVVRSRGEFIAAIRRRRCGSSPRSGSRTSCAGCAAPRTIPSCCRSC